MPPSSAKQLRIAGQWADNLAAWGDLQWETRWGVGGGGLHEVSWSMATDLAFRLPQLRGGVLVELYDGPSRLGAATLDEPDFAAGTFTARGLYRRAEDFLCLTAGGDSTSTPNLAIDQAISRGLQWTRPASISGSAFTSETLSGANYLNTLLDAFVEEESKRWFVDSEKAVRVAPDPVVPAWALATDVADLGRAQDGYASALFGRYKASSGLETASVVDAAAVANFERVEAPIDLTELGTLTEARATAILAGLLRDRSRPAFSQRIEVTSDQLTTLGGVPADLSMVQSGQMVRIHGLYDDMRVLGGRIYLDFVIGETQYVDQAETISIAPMGIAPRGLRAVIAATGTRRRFRA